MSSRASILIFLTCFVFVARVEAQDRQSSQSDTNRDAYAVEGSILNDHALIADAERGLHHLYNMEYGAADSIFTAIGRRFPGHPVGPFLKSLVSWWIILPQLESGEEAEDDAFYKAMQDVIRLSEKMLDRDKNDFDAMFFKGAAHGFRGRLRSNRQEWLNAGKDGKSALEYIFRIADADTSNADFQFGAGVYNYFASVIPEQYPIVKPMLFFFPSADKELGLTKLTQTATRGRLIQTEAVYFMLQIYLIYEPDFQKAIRYASWLTGKYPQNAFFRLMQARVYVKWNRWAQAIVDFDTVTAGHASGKAGYTDALASVAAYYQGRYHMQSGRNAEARIAFETVDSLTTGKHTDSRFRIEAVLRLGMLYDVIGDPSAAEIAYRRVLEMRKRGDSHERARRYLNTPYGQS